MSTPTLMGLPLELRHNIFRNTAVRPEGARAPKKILRRWFEKKEVKAKIAKDTSGDVLQPDYDDYNYDDSSDDDGDSDSDEDADQDDNDEDEEDQDEEEEEEDGEDEDEDDVIQAALVPAAVSVTAHTNLIQAAVVAAAVTDDDQNGMAGDQGQAEEEEEDDDMTDEQDAAEEEEQDDDMTDEQGAAEEDDDVMTNQQDAAEEDDDDVEVADGHVDGNNTTTADPSTSANTTTTAAPPTVPVRFIQPHRKWRYITNFLRISDCPPPVNLLQTSKELNKQAMDWYYDITIIQIDATGSFAHTSMFEEALEQIANAAHSPFENIRKILIKFVWDTEWMRGPDCQGFGSVFDSMLYVRVEKIIEVLQLAPELKEITLEWHDSVQDDLSITFKAEIFERFITFPGVKTIMNEHYLNQGEKPRRKSTLGRKRLELQAIADSGFRLN